MRVILLTNTNKASVAKENGKYLIKGMPITVNGAKMNRVLYPEDENSKGMPTMIGKPISLTHPADGEGRNVSIFSPEGIDFYSGGKVNKTYSKDGIWYSDSSIDEKKLRSTEEGEYFANRLDKGLPIGLSTGLTFEANNESGDGYDMVARNMNFDHLAMLHESEKPAGGDSTVMRFNGEDVSVINIDDIEKPLADKDEPSDNFIDKVANKLKALFANDNQNSYNNTDLINQDGERAMRNLIEAKLKAAGIKVNGLDEDALLLAYNELQAPKEPAQEPQTNSEETPAWAKDLVAKVNTLESKLTANAEQELDSIADQVEALKMGINKDAAKAMGLDAAKSFLAANSTEYVASGYGAPQKRTAQTNAKIDDGFDSVDLNAGLEGDK